MHPPYTALHSLLSQLHPHRQRIDEQPHHSFPPLLPLHPPQQHRPEYHILTSRHPPQHLPPRQMTQARRAHPYSPRTLPHPPPQLLLHCTPPLPDPSPISCTSCIPYGNVGSSTSPSSSRKYASCSCCLPPSRACATTFRNGCGSGNSAPLPTSCARISCSIISCVM